jgi:O-antigen ligase
VPRRVRLPLLVVLLAGPFVLAFFSGGFFDEPRLYAGLAACALVVVAAIASRQPLPQAAPGRLALAGLALLAVWTAVSISWAPESTSAVADADRLLLYLTGFAAALAVLDTRWAVRAIEPALALGCLVVIGYGLSERLLPGALHFERDLSTFGRLAQPLTYWNAMGTLGAIGVVLCARLTADASRSPRLRAVAAGASVPLFLGTYLTYSRGALGAMAVGLAVLLVLARDSAQVRALALLIPAGVVACVPGALFDGVQKLEGPMSTREGQGAAMLAILAALMAAVAFVQLRRARRESTAAAAPRALGRRARIAVIAGFVAVVVAAFAVPAILNEQKLQGGQVGATNARLAPSDSNRFAYWRVALKTFGDHPLKGIGSGGFSVAWLRERDIPQFATDAHSLYIETPAELGIVGLLALALFLGGVVWGAARAHARDPLLAIGLVAALSVWLVHAGLDWLWEMPAVTLPALLVAAALLRTAEGSPAGAASVAGDWRGELAHVPEGLSGAGVAQAGQRAG